MQRLRPGHFAAHGAAGTSEHPVLSGPNAVGLVHHAVQPQPRLRAHAALHAGGRVPAVSAAPTAAFRRRDQA